MKLRTYTGIYFDPVNPTPDMVCIEDIAHALSNQARFAGHLPRFYSVAEHSVTCSFYAKQHPLLALLHDATEAYVTDVPTPIKRLIPEFGKLEQRIWDNAIAPHFGLPTGPFPEEVKRVDHEVLLLELEGIEHPLSPPEAKEQFLSTFRRLTK